uniref:Uncharacterized protein n=2 Tax=Cacopsylla melanoneura TaxID=428564 RepID=A0A8D8M5W5_9HEMI
MYSRYAQMNEMIKRALQSINISSQLEPPGLMREDGKRPDGVTNIAWERGRALVWDATCSDSLARTNRNESEGPGFSSENAARKKHLKYIRIKDNYCFLAFSVETLGPWASESISFLKKVGSALHRVSGDPRSHQFLVQRLSQAIQRGNSLSIRSTLPPSQAFDEVFYL